VEDFYTAYYAVTQHSAAHRAFCERVFGLDLCQHGFADMEQLELLAQATGLGPADRALDLGCGSGMIAEYLSDRTGAHITGLDYIPEAIRVARERTAAKATRLAFMVGDINRLGLPAAAFDVILSIDTLYFSNDYVATLRALKGALAPGGRLGLLYSHGPGPGVDREAFQKETLAPDRTPLADALQANGLAFRTLDLTRQDYRLALRRREVLAELEPQFAADGALFIHKDRLGDAQGISRSIEEGLHRRYLYAARPGT
jgi:SAM-dependent methyltransferase